jgi:superfamily I DNA and/or RNA helicase
MKNPLFQGRFYSEIPKISRCLCVDLEMTIMIEIVKKNLARYKELLANFSKRNRELYYKVSKSTSVSLSRHIFEKRDLTSESKFSPLFFSSRELADLLKGKKMTLNDFFEVDLVSSPERANSVMAKLDRVRLADDKFQKEYGIFGAWILGPFLCWRVPGSTKTEEMIMSPIFKIPVNFSKEKKKKLSMEAEQDGIILNPSFELAIKKSFGIKLSQIDISTPELALKAIIEQFNAESIEINYTNEIKIPASPQLIKIKKDEEGNIAERINIPIEEALSKTDLEIYQKVNSKKFLIIDELYLDQLNASRSVLLNDYEGILANGLENPILGELFSGNPITVGDSDHRSKLKELDSYKEVNNHFVIDIDSTQHRAIDRASKARAIVIQGPPGAGKSQTIVNLIADNLSKGKKILFVAEKRPALDVVYNRLKKANISNQAVLIHSSDLNKTELYNSFLELANMNPDKEDVNRWNQVSTELDQIKGKINQVADIYTSKVLNSNLAVSEVLVEFSKIDPKDYDSELAHAFKNIDFETLKQVSEISEKIEDLNNQVNLSRSVWAMRNPGVVSCLDLRSKLEELNRQIVEVESKRTEIEVQFGEIFKDFDTAQISKLISIKNVKPEGLSNLSKIICDDSRSALSELESCLEKIESILKLESISSHYFQLCDDDAREKFRQVEIYFKEPRSFLDWFSAKYWGYKKRAKELFPSWDKELSELTKLSIIDKLVIELELLLKKLKITSTSKSQSLNDLKKIESELKSVLEESLALKSLLQAFNVLSVRDEQHLRSFYQNLVQLIGSAENHTLICQNLDKLGERVSDYISVYDQTSNKLKLIKELQERIQDLEIITKADSLLQELDQKSQVANTKQLILPRLKNEKLISKLIFNSVVACWRDEILIHHPKLRDLSGKEIEEFKQEFIKSLDLHKRQSSSSIMQKFANNWVSTGNREGLGLLSRESKKQRRITTPRQLMESGALKTMLDLKPCWLMSPLSISQLLPLESELFDVIIFDEASQVPVEDAIPSIYRASTMIVVGDDKQMPPTAFFGGSKSDDEDEDETGIELADSILDLATQAYPSVLLEWHYRSRSESLIAFSNRAFYGGRLIAAPNPLKLSAARAIEFFRVENGYFKENANVAEAKRVVDHLASVLRGNDQRSVGIITLGIGQASEIQDEIDRRTHSDSTFAKMIDKAYQMKEGEADIGLFVKNLENVQGDERDYIILSVGYAPNGEDKKLRLGFGPISQKGGGRRLNVAVTRAKSNMAVFCSFNPNDIPSDEAAFGENPDRTYFARYLKYAQALSAGNDESAISILNSFPIGGFHSGRKSSRFALDVKRRIEAELQVEVSAEIGSNGFYIDLAIHHPVLRDQFVIGIECDGAIFHSTPYARDRDKIRQALLESRGWKVHRVWSQDWSKNWKGEILKIDAELKKILGIVQTDSSDAIRVS